MTARERTSDALTADPFTAEILRSFRLADGVALLVCAIAIASQSIALA